MIKSFYRVVQKSQPIDFLFLIQTSPGVWRLGFRSACSPELKSHLFTIRYHCVLKGLKSIRVQQPISTIMLRARLPRPVALHLRLASLSMLRESGASCLDGPMP